MAKALDYDEDEEFIFQLQLNEIRKISNPKEETEVFSELSPSFCETDGRVGITNIPLQCDRKTAFTDIPREQSNSQKDLGDEYDNISVHFNPESPELHGSSREMNGGNFKRPDRPYRVIQRGKSMIAVPLKPQTKHPHHVLRCDSMRQQFDIVTDSDPGDRNINGYEDLNPRENLFGVNYVNSGHDYKSNRDRLIPEQVQFEMDKEIATELEKDDINNIEEQDRILAQYMQLESDLESAKKLDKHTNGRGKSRKMGLLMQGNINISQTNNDLPERWSNTSPFEMQRESQVYQRYQHHPDQLRRLFRGTTDRVRPSSVQFLNRLGATDFTTQNHATTEPHPRSALAHIMISAQEIQPGPLGLQHQLLRHNGSRLLRRPSSDFPADDIDVDGLDYEEILELEERIGEVKFLGLKHSDIETLPKETITNVSQIEKKQCSICLEDFRLKDIVRKLPCLHRYHINCIDCWLKRKAECPVCKKNVKGATSQND